MVNRFVDTEIWKKDWFLELSDKQKLLTKFLFDNCDCAGFYKISWNLLKVFFNEPPNREDFEKIKQVKFIEDDLIFIEDFALFQCKVNSFKELNPKNNAHLGVLKLLKKYEIFLSPSLAPSEPLTSPYAGAQEKEKEKDITSNKQINTLSNINIDEKNKKFDPYINPIKTFFEDEYKKVFGQKPYLGNISCNKLVEIAAEDDNIREHIPIAIQALKDIDFKDINFTPTASWLLKDNNFERVINGEFKNKKEEIDGWDL